MMFSNTIRTDANQSNGGYASPAVLYLVRDFHHVTTCVGTDNDKILAVVAEFFEASRLLSPQATRLL